MALPRRTFLTLLWAVAVLVKLFKRHYTSDPPNDLKWIGGIKYVEMLTGPPLGVGSRVARRAAFLGRKIEYVNEVVAFVPGERLEMQSVKGPFPMHITYEFADHDDGRTRVNIRVRGEASGFFKLASPLLAGSVRRNVSRDLARLKRILESPGAE
jgi:uncharacterized membrane protein